ncbi:hypothetical protein PR003_g30419, partial [Phytophthora rubi]
MQTLDLNIITFERVIDTKVSDIFKSMILQHALPASWEYIVRGWLGQAKTLSYVKLMELVSSKLERRRPEGSGQDKGKAEKAYAAVETKPTGGTIERKCFACKKPGHLVADCPENPNRGENIGTSEPSKKKQNTGKQFSKKDTKHARHHVDKRRMQVVSGPVGTVVLTMVTEDVKTMVVTVNRGVNLLVTDHPILNTAVGHVGTGMDVQIPRIITSHVGLVTDLHPQFVTNASMAIQHQDMMIVDTIYNIMPDRHSSTVLPDRHHSTATPDRHNSSETNKAHPSGLVINVDHHPDGAIRHLVDHETSLRRAGVDAHHREAALAHWRTEFQEGEKDLIAAHIRYKGMACIRRGDGNYEYKFERNRASNSGEEEDSDEGVLVITRDDIIANINKNTKMTRTEKRLTRASVKKRFDLEARMEAKRRGYTDRQKAVRRAARAIRRGDNPANWRQELGGSPLSPEDPYASDSVYSEEGLRFLSTAEAQEKQQETLKSLESKLREDMRKCEEGKAVAPSIPATTEGEAVADPTPSQPSAAVAADASAQAKPAMGLVSATSTLNTTELTWVVDTGATSHMCKDIELFEPIESSMETAANPLRILGKGT